MITNATITSIQRPLGASAAGKRIYVQPASLSVACFVSAIRVDTRLELSARLKDATAKLRVLKSTWNSANAGAAPADGDRLAVTLTSGEARAFEVMADENHQHGDLSTYVVFVRAV